MKDERIPLGRVLILMFGAHFTTERLRFDFPFGLRHALLPLCFPANRWQKGDNKAAAERAAVQSKTSFSLPRGVSTHVF